MARKVSKPRMYKLTGRHFVHGVIEHEEQLFTHDEKETAMEITKLWYEKGWCPVLTSKVFDGSEFKTWFDFRKEDAKKNKTTKKKVAA